MDIWTTQTFDKMLYITYSISNVKNDIHEPINFLDFCNIFIINKKCYSTAPNKPDYLVLKCLIFIDLFFFFFDIFHLKGDPYNFENYQKIIFYIIFTSKFLPKHRLNLSIF